MPHATAPAPQRLTWLRWGCTTAMGLSLWCAGAAMAFDLQGHRGARGLAPENTLAGFRKAIEIGVTTLETDLADESGSSAADPYEQVLLSSESGQLYDCLGKLDDAKRSSILLAYLDGCTHTEIASRMKTPLGTVKAWVKRSLAALRDCIG